MVGTEMQALLTQLAAPLSFSPSEFKGCPGQQHPVCVIPASGPIQMGSAKIRENRSEGLSLIPDLLLGAEIFYHFSLSNLSFTSTLSLGSGIAVVCSL